MKLAATSLRQIVEKGKEARAQGDYGEALAMFEIACVRDPENASFSRYLRETGVQRYGGVLEEMMSVSAKALGDKGQDAFAREDFVEATRLFEMLHLREPDNLRALRCLAECYMHDGAKARATRCLEQALALKPADKGIIRRLVEIRRPWWKRLGRKEKPFPVSHDPRGQKPRA